MKKVLSILILIIISIVGCKKYDFGEIPDYHYLIVSDTYIPWWSGKYWINFSSDYEIRIGSVYLLHIVTNIVPLIRSRCFSKKVQSQTILQA